MTAQQGTRRNDERSRSAFEEAKQYIPGGVNSPVRAFKSVGLTPIYAERGEGSKIYDIDGNVFIDYVGSWGPLIMGHAHPDVVEALRETALKGTSFGAPTLLETEMAKLVCERVPSIDIVRMVNSGTEATMSAIRLARGVTGRSKILKFEGSYHGHADSLLIKAGSGVATLGLPDSPGVPEGVAINTITVPYNDLESVKLAFERYGEELAAIIVEPVAGNMGVVPPVPGFLEGLRSLTSQYGSLLIFDEVMTGFRVGLNCAQGRYGVTPDLTCLGKVIGGGLPVGAYGGRRDLMEQIAPTGPIYQAGTLSGNPLAMAAGYTTLKLLTPEVYDRLETLSARLQAGFEKNAAEAGIAITINRVGSMVCPFFSAVPVTNYDIAKESNLDQFRRYFAAMIDQGVSVAPSQYEGMFVSGVHTEQDIDDTIEANRKALQSL
ncbi:glutamate-1-semialdehyde 2,1-aminomutase [Paenibacillus sp. UMB7766-LJ446]|uniref:glutamate-1-semialdehyde 2,1-aminomutase n=1 Tax=Paenibacillus TaxID=44249 RepID=UPI0009A4337F|nr:MULTISPECIES: glutamate-1-semialdehyde 2,1-aminomutase [Paenibacillus]MDK8191979.1 glutamate-1-semialdehyde 2,1-aminomutase [Paenibacillus sp. UMB7766-LJ446]OPG97910.1 glutamate-1-semialdehyde-2,1-aminomutase [Chryseobacterium mucoviscidosis]OZQ71211.1 glutamate-1-semialdehyde-2,1-aminomutase [Paenibacillus taichungensis]HBU85930.1 glutamate-1-semialdehyde-2,1-aminomutase [Paenibacillus sp.]